MSATKRLVLWDIDHTLLYAGEIDQVVYQRLFWDLMGRDLTEPTPRGTGFTVPITVRNIFERHGVSADQLDELTERALSRLPDVFAENCARMKMEGYVLPGARAALDAVHSLYFTVSSVVSGNLRPVSLCKLKTFDLDGYVDIDVGAFGSDSSYRPSLVALAQQRAAFSYGHSYDRENTVIIGDSLEDVLAGRKGGASVIAVATGSTATDDLRRAGADLVLPDLLDTEAVRDAVVALTA